MILHVITACNKVLIDCIHHLHFLFMGIVTYRDNLMISISRGISVVIIILSLEWSIVLNCILYYFWFWFLCLTLVTRWKTSFFIRLFLICCLCLCLCFLVFKAAVKNKTCVPSGISKWTIHGLWYKLSFF